MKFVARIVSIAAILGVLSPLVSAQPCCAPGRADLIRFGGGGVGGGIRIQQPRQAFAGYANPRYAPGCTFCSAATNTFQTRAYVNMPASLQRPAEFDEPLEFASDADIYNTPSQDSPARDLRAYPGQLSKQLTGASSESENAVSSTPPTRRTTSRRRSGSLYRPPSINDLTGL